MPSKRFCARLMNSSMQGGELGRLEPNRHFTCYCARIIVEEKLLDVFMGAPDRRQLELPANDN
jgi:hypothetical protein